MSTTALSIKDLSTSPASSSACDGFETGTNFRRRCTTGIGASGFDIIALSGQPLVVAILAAVAKWWNPFQRP
jgi:hypothetical protein